MRFASLCLIAGLAGLAPAAEPARLAAAPSAVVAPSGAGKFPVFADPAVKAFVAEADAAARKAAPLTPEFWAWVDAHPDVRAGLLFARHPMPAQSAQNLDTLRRALSPALADKYAQLLLGVAIRDGALRLEAETPARDYPPAVAKVAAWMRTSGTSYLQVMAGQEAALKAAGVNVAETKDRTFWGQVALAAGTYPPRLAPSDVQFLVWMISKLETPAPAEAKQPWPIFPTAQAPWPLLTWFKAAVPERECEWIWERYWGRIPGQPAGIIGYGRYSWDYDRVPEVKYKASAWHPGSLPRIWEDGGVCGRLSTMADTFRRALGQPARGTGQPGHRAFVHYGRDPKTGRWTFGVGQSIAGLEVTTTGPDVPALHPFIENRAVNCVALVQAMNLGLERFHRGRILGWFALGQTDVARRERYLRQALALNPYELGLWKALGDGVADGPAAARLLAEMDQALLTPNAALEVAKRLSADTDFASLGGGQSDAKADRGATVAKLAGDALAGQVFGRLLASGRGLAEARTALRAELARREALKVPYDAAIAENLLGRYDLQVDGVARVLAAAHDAVLAADGVKPAKPRAAAVDRVVERLRVLGEADAKLVSDWAAGVVKELASAGPRWLPDKKGVPQAEPLYAEVHTLRLRALRKLGKAGKTALAEAVREYELGKPPVPAPAPAGSGK